MEWTKEQKRIIDLNNSNILVSAAAGSGKTAVMVERIIRLVKSGQDIDKFLVVTFTKAAARGMKQKIQKSMVKAVQNKEGDIKHLRKQLSLLNKALITTIDSFCMDVVKKNFHLAELDPDFRVGDNSELNILLQDSIDEVLEDAYKTIDSNKNFMKLVEGFTGNRGDDELSEIIKNTYRFILSFPDPFTWLDESVEKLNLTGDDLKESEWLKETKNHIQLLLEGAKSCLKTAIEISREANGPYLYLDMLIEDLNNVNNLTNLLHSDFSNFIQALISLEYSKAPTFKKDKYNDVDPEKQIEVNGAKGKKGLRGDYKDIITSIKELLPYNDDYDKYAQDIRKMYNSICALKDLIIEVHEKYKSKKEEKSIVDFNDLEHYALKILRTTNEEKRHVPSDVAESYRKKFNFIFIDEYQDSNSLQEAIIEQIKRENNLFMVGDVKQSIYKFRLADPSIFNYKYESFVEDHEDLSSDIIDRVISLNKNFRSRDEILTGTNFVFKNIMTKELGEIDYNEKVFLNTGSEFVVNNPIELYIIDKNSEIEEDVDVESNNKIDDEIESMETAELEALFAAQKIKELMKEEICIAGKPVGEEIKTRKTEYKDIVILLRSVANWASIFEDRLNKEDIPFYYDGGKGYYDTIEVQVIVSLLKLIDNMRQDIPLLSVMRSPIGNFTTEELLEIRTKFPKEKHFISAFNKYISSDFSLELTEKLKRFKGKIYGWSLRSRYSHLNDLIWDILMETNYYNFVGALPNGKMRQANLRLLADLSYDFEKTSMRGLFKFLRYIEKVDKGGDDKGQAKTLGENDNVVRLMSIHKSKGLEFPVVILCGLNKQINIRDTVPKILLHKELGIGTKFIDIDNRIERETLSRTTIKNNIKKENISEEMRVLYVAMTRAVDKLILAGTVNKLEDKLKKWRKGHSKYFVYKGLSYMDWICSCLFENVNYDELNEIFEKGDLKDWKVNKFTRSDLSSNMKDEIVSKKERIAQMKEFKNQNNSDLYYEIGRRLSFKYSFESSVNVPTKLSVTELNNLKKNEFAKLRYKIPPLTDVIKFNEESNKFILDKKISGPEIGTLLHFVMEHLNLNSELTKEDIIKQIKLMEHKKMLTNIEADIMCTYAAKIEKFFNNYIGIRIRKSQYVKREVPFVFRKNVQEVLDRLNKDDLILVQGIIDCYFFEDDEVIIVDYKTDAIDETKELNGQIIKLKKEYKDQVYLYKEAVEKITNKNVKECYLYLFSIGREVLVDF
ncbi:MAG: helicase-exonuclease AddAB subunit AddA [Tissierellia bacterium]|nr:helicase-exonuclease AddAB subunit AddA [Tissierellia bacterium]